MVNIGLKILMDLKRYKFMEYSFIGKLLKFKDEFLFYPRYNLLDSLIKSSLCDGYITYKSIFLCTDQINYKNKIILKILLNGKLYFVDINHIHLVEVI